MTSVTFETRDYDLVVLGAGPMGTALASWVKRERLETSVALADERPVPGYKIAERTISTTINPIVSLGAAVAILSLRTGRPAPGAEMPTPAAAPEAAAATGDG